MDVTNDVKPRVEMYTWWILIWFVVLCALLSFRIPCGQF